MRSKGRKWFVMKAYSSERHGYFGRNVWRGKKEKKKGSEEGTVEDNIYIYIYIYSVCVGFG
jgi:hypothetical protein